METPLIIFLVLVTLISIALIIMSLSEFRQRRAEEARANIKLNRLLKYRDKAKLLDEFMTNVDMKPSDLQDKYDKICKR